MTDFSPCPRLQSPLFLLIAITDLRWSTFASRCNIRHDQNDYSVDVCMKFLLVEENTRRKLLQTFMDT